jgi:hypothetical protein
LETNKALFVDDVMFLAGFDDTFLALLTVGNLFPALIGTSQDMANTINALIFALTDGASGLPSFASYEIFGVAKDASEPFSATGDLDGDGISNIEELAMVEAAGGGKALFLRAATDPTNMWPGNPGVPVGGLIGMGLLAVAFAAGGAAVIRRRK